MLTKMPLISVVVPVYQIEDYLEKCIESVKAQSFTDWELILVDDGSTDKCPEICDKYSAEDNRIKVLHKKNEGLLQARKDGTALAAATYVTFIDGDDYILPERLENLWKAVEETSADIIATSYVNRYENGEIQPAKKVNFSGFYSEEMMTDAVKEYFMEMSNKESPFVHSWSKLYKKEILEEAFQNISSQISYGEDAVTVLATLNLAKSMYVINDKSYVYNIIFNSMSHGFRPNLLFELEKLIEEIKDLPLLPKNSKIRENYINENGFKLIGTYIGMKSQYIEGPLLQSVRKIRKELEGSRAFSEFYRNNKNHPIKTRSNLFYWFLVRKIDIACALLLGLKRIHEKFRKK